MYFFDIDDDSFLFDQLDILVVFVGGNSFDLRLISFELFLVLLFWMIAPIDDI